MKSTAGSANKGNVPTENLPASMPSFLLYILSNPLPFANNSIRFLIPLPVEVFRPCSRIIVGTSRGSSVRRVWMPGTYNRQNSDCQALVSIDSWVQMVVSLIIRPTTYILS